MASIPLSGALTNCRGSVDELSMSWQYESFAGGASQETGIHEENGPLCYALQVAVK